MKYTAITATCIATLAMASAAYARDFTIAAWGGNYQDAQRAAYFTDFAASKGLKLVETTYLGGLAELKTMSDTGDVIWDLIMMGGSDAQLACDEGLLEEINWDTLPHADELIPAARKDCSVGSVIIGNGMGYNTEAFPEPPNSWADFFDLEKFPGKRGIRNAPAMNLERALIADGVPLDKVYEVLSTPEGVDRAFAKLDTIKSEMQFWDAGSQPVEWLLAGNVALSTGYNGRFISAKKDGKPLEYVWNEHIYNIDVWAVPKDSPFKAEAMEFFAIANDAAAQAKFSALMPYGPTNSKAPDLIAPEAAANLPAGANNANALSFSDEFWIENNDALTERWANWVIQ